jgi:hypothetical protein
LASVLIFIDMNKFTFRIPQNLPLTFC